MLFSNRGGYNNRNNCQQYSCRCYRKGSKKHRRKQCCKCCGYGSGYGGYGGHGGYGGGYGGYGGGYGGCGGGYGNNIIFIIIILFFIRLGKSSGLGSISSILNFLPTQGTDDIDTNEEE
ncbi:hypothetical protein [Clostridium ganghwense]|uniref:hypothetical protein n=1 Tax=Clostridium ganghwense TaxID=312089 RepID=UPI00227BA3CF|nr:hypothetical protein [Clostridium ganghwense]